MNTLRTFTIGTFVFEYFNKTISRNVPNIPLLLNDTILQKGAMFSAKRIIRSLYSCQICGASMCCITTFGFFIGCITLLYVNLDLYHSLECQGHRIIRKQISQILLCSFIFQNSSFNQLFS